MAIFEASTATFKNPCKLKQELIEVIAARKDSTNRFVISVSKMNEGAKLLRTILELSTPGTVPDNNIMKECLRIESPVLCRHGFIDPSSKPRTGPPGQSVGLSEDP